MLLMYAEYQSQLSQSAPPPHRHTLIMLGPDSPVSHTTSMKIFESTKIFEFNDGVVSVVKESMILVARNM